MQVMALHLGLGELRQLRRFTPAHIAWDKAFRLTHRLADLGIGWGENLAAATRIAELHHHRFVPDRRVIAGKLSICAHLPTASFSAEARRSISSRVWTSVTQ